MGDSLFGTKGKGGIETHRGQLDQFDSQINFSNPFDPSPKKQMKTKDERGGLGKTKNVTIGMMRDILVKNLNKDDMRTTMIGDINALMHEDQIKQVNEKAMEDFWEKDILEAKGQHEQAQLAKRLMSMRTFNNLNLKPAYMIDHTGLFRFFWDLLIVTMNIVNIIFIPFEVSFKPEFASTAGYMAFDYIFDTCFVIDIIFNFRTSFTDNNGEKVYNTKEIAKRYVGTVHFICDVVAVIQLHLIFGNDDLKFSKILKVAAITRLTKIIMHLTFKEEVKALLKLTYTVLQLCLYIHFISCIFNRIVIVDKVWVPPFDYYDYTKILYFREETGIMYRYLTSIYYMVACIGGNELGPVASAEIVFICFCMIASFIINATLFGEMSFLLTVIGKKDAEYQLKVDTANTAMKNINLIPGTQSKIRDYLLFTQSTRDQQEELEKFLILLSPSLKDKVQKHIFTDTLRNNRILAQVVTLNMEYQQERGKESKEDFVTILVSKLDTELYIPEDTIVKQDEDNYDIYFIAKGQCWVQQRDQKKNEYQIQLLEEGDHFGEIGMIYKCKRTCTIQSRNYNTMAKLSEENYKTLISEFPEYNKFLKLHIHTYQDKKKKFLKEVALRVDYLKNISEEALHDVIYSLKPIYLEKGYVLLKPDDTAESLYFIEDGIVELYTTFEGNEFVLERLYQGSAVNFRAFFMDDFMYVYVRCSKPTLLLELDKKTLELIKSQHSDFERSCLSYQNNMLKMKKTFPLDYIMNLPKEYREVKNNEVQEGIWRRENIFKNVIMRRIIEIRMIKKKPKLSDLLRMMKGKDLSDPKVKADFKRKILALYDENEDAPPDEDAKYDKLMANFDRVQKVLSAQQMALDNLEKKVTVLQKRREEREMDPEKILKIKNKYKQMETKKEEQKVTGSTIQVKEASPKKSGNDQFTTPSFAHVRVPINKITKQPKQEALQEMKAEDELEEPNTVRLQRVEKEHLVSSEDEKKFEKLKKIAGKYKKDEAFAKFKSPLLGNMSASSDEQNEDNDDENMGKDGYDYEEQDSDNSMF